MSVAPPFRAEHVGSLLRPKELMAAREDHAQGRMTAAERRQIEDESIRQVVALQEQIGLCAVTDGEFRRGSWHMDFLYQIRGVTTAGDRQKATFHNEHGDLEFSPTALHITDKLTLDRCIFGEDFQFLKSITTKVPKLTIPAPSLIHYRGGRASIDKSAYPDMDQFWDDVARVYADEISRLWKLGCTYLQLDDTSLAYLNDPRQREYVTELGGDGARQHLTYIRVFNQALASKPSGMTVSAHLCRGNFRSSWVATGGYEYVAEAVFNQLNVAAFFLEYDDARSGGFEPLRFVPKDKMVVLGLVTSKKPALETKDYLKRRLDEASKYVPLDQICLSPQCGFSSTVDGNALTLREEIDKLQLVVDTAREVWG